MRLPAAHTTLIFFATLVVATALGTEPALADPPQFGVEIEAGTTAGFTSYLRNEVVTETDRSQTDDQGRFLLEPSLADVETGTGLTFAARLVASSVAGGFSFKWFDLPANEIHHVGQSSITQTRVRADGSVDDHAVDYVPLDSPIEAPIAEENREQLYVLGMGGEYRFIWPGEAFDVYIPVGGELMFSWVTREENPYRVGLEANSGLGMSVEFVDGVSLMLNGKLHGLVTSHYGNRADAARRAVNIGQTTEEAYFSTLLYGTANIALQFTIR